MICRFSDAATVDLKAGLSAQDYIYHLDPTQFIKHAARLITKSGLMA